MKSPNGNALFWWMSLFGIVCAIAVGIGGIKALGVIAGIAILALVIAVLWRIIQLWEQNTDEPKDEP